MLGPAATGAGVLSGADSDEPLVGGPAQPATSRAAKSAAPAFLRLTVWPRFDRRRPAHMLRRGLRACSHNAPLLRDRAGAGQARRSEERRVGKACVSTFSYRGWPYLNKKT